MDYLQPHELYSPWNSPGEIPSLGDLPNTGIEPRILHYRQILYQLSHKGSPYIYIHPLFFRFSVHLGHQEHSVKFPVLYNRFSLVVYFLHSSGFYFVYNFLSKTFMFHQVPFIYFCFYYLYVRRGIQKTIAVIYVRKWSAYVFLQEFYSIPSYIQDFNSS